MEEYFYYNKSVKPGREIRGQFLSGEKVFNMHVILTYIRSLSYRSLRRSRMVASVRSSSCVRSHSRPIAISIIEDYDWYTCSESIHVCEPQCMKMSLVGTSISWHLFSLSIILEVILKILSDTEGCRTLLDLKGV